MKLRDYQQEATAVAIATLSEGKHPALQLATGTGKSLIITDVARHYLAQGLRVWVLAHVQELIQQNARAYTDYTGYKNYGIVCSGLGCADYDSQLTFATVQSIMRPALDGRIPAPDLIIIDEVHRVPHKTGESGMYARVLEHFPLARRLGMTATPWRTDNGIIWGEDLSHFWFNCIPYTYSVERGVAEGYLAPLVGVETEVQLDLEDVSVGDDYNNTQVASKETNEWLGGVARSVAHLCRNRKHVAVYCPTVVAAMRAAAAIARETGWNTKILTGSMSKKERAATLDSFSRGETRVLCSIDTLTTGWNLPALDCIVGLRPTVSSSLFVQMLGRGTRTSPGKKNALVLDFVGNLQRLGGVGMMDTYVREWRGEAGEPVEAKPAAPKAPRVVHPGVRSLIPLDPMTGNEVTEGSVLTVAVSAVTAVPIATRRNPKVPVLLVQYTTVTPEGAKVDAALFLNTEQNTQQAYEFFKARNLAVNLPAPASALLWQVRGAARPATVTIKKSGRYWNILSENWTTE